MGNAKSLEIFAHGEITVSLNQPYWISGQQLSGTVTLNLRDFFTTDKLQLEFVGREKCYFDTHERSSSGPGSQEGKKNIVRKINILKVYEQGRVLPGLHQFPFTVDLEGWFPSSFLYCGPKQSMMKVQYYIRAGMEDINQRFSPVYAEKVVIVHQPPVSINYNIPLKLSRDVKALFFMKSGNTSADIMFEKDAYQPNETVKVYATIYNQACDQNINKISLKLRRDIVAYASNGMEYREKKTIIKQTQQGIPPRSQDQRVLQLDLSTIHLDNKSQNYFSRYQNKISAEEQKLLQLLQPSIKTTLLSCLYTLEVYIDHGIIALGNRMEPAVLPVFIYSTNIQRNFQQQAPASIISLEQQQKQQQQQYPLPPQVYQPTNPFMPQYTQFHPQYQQNIQNMPQPGSQGMPQPGSQGMPQPGSQGYLNPEQPQVVSAPQKQVQQVEMKPYQQPEYIIDQSQNIPYGYPSLDQPGQQQQQQQQYQQQQQLQQPNYNFNALNPNPQEQKKQT